MATETDPKNSQLNAKLDDMAVKTTFLDEEFVKILANYDLGSLQTSEPISKGTVQTNFVLHTTKGRLIFRYYENRTKESVLFECSLIKYLKTHNYPCPDVFSDNQGEFVGEYKSKPYVIFEFVEGSHLENPNENQKDQLIEKVAEIHNLTKDYTPVNKQFRWNYNIELCRELAKKEAAKINTSDSKLKLAWFESELGRLEFPESLPKGICHCDFHFSNVLFKDGKFVVLIDFDDANYTYLLFDLVGLIESEAWIRDKDKELNFTLAEKVVLEYTKYRQLRDVEQKHLFDVYKLSILFDCVWYFGRGSATDFFEKTKIDFLNEVGAEEFYRKLFG